ncbi:MAG TPA: 50S ribosomal protein L29 [Firmicutes bacterium]|nr:50S ribosomal protein L29 [Candidatus Fermentithermobacillaceae bacterium]
MKAQEIRSLSDADLEKRLLDLQEELFNLRFQMTTGQLDDVMRIREVKRSIARVKTIQRQRELAKLPQEG